MRMVSYTKFKVIIDNLIEKTLGNGETMIVRKDVIVGYSESIKIKVPDA